MLVFVNSNTLELWKPAQNSDDRQLRVAILELTSSRSVQSEFNNETKTQEPFISSTSDRF